MSGSCSRESLEQEPDSLEQEPDKRNIRMKTNCIMMGRNGPRNKGGMYASDEALSNAPS